MAGEWKTIDQRERTQSRARRTQRRGVASAVLGGGLLAAVEAHRPGGVLMTGRVLRRTMGPKARRLVHPMIRHDALKTVYESDPATVMGSVAGGTLVGGGAVGYAQGRTREAYQQRRINSRRKANAARGAVPVEKGLGALLRRGRSKPSGPILRYGRVRMGEPGVEYEHEGVRGWGRTESAAQAAWEQNRAAVSKRGVNPHPDQPRYGGGGGHGRRVIEKSAAGQPAGRKPTLARRGGQAPAGGQARQPAAALAAPQAPVLARRPISGIVPLTTQAPAAMAKADRYFDPEDRRQRRVGAAGTAGALGGAALGYSGGREMAATARGLHRLADPQLRLSRLNPVEGPLRRGEKRRKQLTGIKPNTVTRDELAALRGLHLSPRAAGKLGAGAALLAGSAALVRRGDDPRRRRWN